MLNLEKIDMLIKAGNFSEAAGLLDELLRSEADNAQAWYLRGKIWWRKGMRSEAMSCYAKAVAIDADSPAAFALEQARDIADFFNPDLLNP